MKKVFLPALSLALLASCGNPPADTDIPEDAAKVIESEDVTAEPENDAPENYEKDGLKIYPHTGSPVFETASLERKTPKDGKVAADGKIMFDFAVKNYELGAQTEGAGTNGLANSDKGQHIHLIVDNGPYSAHYEPTFSMDFEDGHHVAIAFLSRSFHESVKNANAATIFQFTTGEDNVEHKPLDLNKPMLFYSRPKGEYTGDATKKILLDFYVANTELKPDGHSVVVTINDKSKFEFDNWQPYIIEGLPMGKNTINIKLVDAQGNMVASEMNDVTRTFTLVQ